MTEDERLAHVKLGFDKARRNEVHAIFPRKLRHEVTRPFCKQATTFTSEIKLPTFCLDTSVNQGNVRRREELVLTGRCTTYVETGDNCYETEIDLARSRLLHLI